MCICAHLCIVCVVLMEARGSTLGIVLHCQVCVLVELGLELANSSKLGGLKPWEMPGNMLTCMPPYLALVWVLGIKVRSLSL